MIRALVVDDEQHCIQRIKLLVKNNLSDSVEIIAVASSVDEGLDAIRQFSPDLVFLDVQLQNRTAFDLLSEISQRKFEIIFTTAYDQYAVRAFRFSALDYLLKPVDGDELIQAVSRLKERNNPDETTEKLNALFHNMKSIQGTTKRICVPVLNGIVFLQVNEIIRCQSEVNYTTFYLKDKPNLVVAKTLKEFEELLSDYNFFRVHNSHLVNLAFIKSYNKGKGGYITMTDNSVVEVSTRRKDLFLKKLAEI